MAKDPVQATQALARRASALQAGMTTLPLFRDGDSAIPNHLARSSLFAPIQRGRRPMHDNALLATPAGGEIRYSGKQLDMADQDVFLAVMKLAAGQDPRKPVRINRSDFLRMIGRRNGSSDYRWLDESFRRLTLGTISLHTSRINAHLSLIVSWVENSEVGDWEVVIGERILSLFASREYAFIDLEQRMRIERNTDLAKWLQAYACTHAPGLHRVSVDNLKTWCGNGGRLRDFRSALTEALAELVRVGCLDGFGFYGDGEMVSWTRGEVSPGEVSSG